jgi:hypothetical protein
MPTAILRGAGAVPHSLAEFGVRSFKLGKEFTHWTKPTGSCVFKTLTNTFLSIRLRGVIQLPVHHSLDGHGIDLWQKALFFKRVFEAGVGVVKCWISSGVHFSPFSLVQSQSFFIQRILRRSS